MSAGKEGENGRAEEIRWTTLGREPSFPTQMSGPAPEPNLRPTKLPLIWPALIFLNVAVFAVETWLRLKNPELGDRIYRELRLLPRDVQAGKVWQLLSFQFLHANLSHLALNLMGLWFFGRPLEVSRGRTATLALYLVTGAVGGFAHCVLGWVFPFHYGKVAVVGASAGLYGMIGAFAWAHWSERFTSSFLGGRINYSWTGQGLFVLFLVVGVVCMLDTKAKVAHDAHLGGMIMGLVFCQAVFERKKRPVKSP